jgi:pimeloyl-ACP methyl ester carboxylesterase
VALLCHVFPQSNGLPTPQATIEYRTVQVQAGIQLDVAVAGPARAKDAMVLLHGYPECSWFWRGVVDPLLKGGDLQLWMPDQRGFNHSSKPNGITSYNVTDLVADIVGLVGHLQSERGDPAGSKVHVLGHDWGGPVAWLVAGWHPEITKTLTILNGPHPSIFIDELRHDHEQQQRSSYMLFFDTPAASLVDPADMFKGAQWWDAATARAYAAACKS